MAVSVGGSVIKNRAVVNDDKDDKDEWALGMCQRWC